MVDMKKLIKVVFLFILMVFFFISGMGLSSRYAVYTEMQFNEELLIRNLNLLSGCKKKYYQCDAGLQELIINENDRALDQLFILEREVYTKNIVDKITSFFWPAMYLITFDVTSIKESGNIKSYYDELGCGLSGEKCE